MEQRQTIDDVINGLSGDLQPVAVMGHPLSRALPSAILCALYVLFVSVAIGFRDDITSKLVEPLFVTEIILSLAIAFSASVTSAWLCVPDMRGQRWLLAVPVALFAGMSVIYMQMTFAQGFEFVHLEWQSCVYQGFYMIGLPLLAVLVMSRKGRTTHPFWMSLNNTLSVGMMGWVGLRFTCGADSVDHIFTYHFFPFVVVGFLLLLFARCIYRW